MLHENSDDGTLCKNPLGYRKGQQLSGLMTLQNFIDGGSEVADAKILVVIKSIGMKKKGACRCSKRSRDILMKRSVTRKDNSIVDNINVHLHDDTAEVTLSLWGTSASSPLGQAVEDSSATSDNITSLAKPPWRPGETILLLQNPTLRLNRSVGHTLS
jgi:hypothetical protein